MRIDTFTQNTPPDHRLAEVVFLTRLRWLRLGVTYGMPPGSHIGYWRTRIGDMRGWNLRVGKRYVRTLTLFAFTRPPREHELRRLHHG